MTSRYFLLLAFLPLLTVTARAGTREDVLAGAARCAGIPDDRGWLDCFYGSAQPMRAQLGLPPAPASQVGRVPPPGGLARPAQPMPAQPMSAPAVTASVPTPPPHHGGFLGGVFGGSANDIKMTAYHFDRHGMFTVTLANGETWQQMDDDVNFAHWRGAAANYNVSVADGGFGHASLTVENDGQTYEVRRAN